jgi:hypothetical protein
MGRRSRKARAASAPQAPAPAAPAAGEQRTARGYARSRERDAAARAALEPLAPGERPLAVTIAAVVAALLAVTNVAFYLAGWEVAGEDPKPGGVFLFAGILLAAAIGMWLRRYWAVLGFQVLLGITVIYAGLSLLFPSNWQAVVLAVAVLLAAGTLFWFLIRAMARLQMPER